MIKWHKIGAVVLGMLMTGMLYAGTTGKIVGKVVDKKTGEGLPGAGVIIVENNMGTATDLDGSYILINVPPGNYTLKASYLGYNDQIVKDVSVKADLTTEINFYLVSTAIVQETVTVTATRKLVEKSQTRTERRVSAKDIASLPYTDFQQAINLQAGVTGVNVVRGGRDDEVSYYIDGMQVTSPIFGGYYANINTSAIQEMSLLAGGYNAEYGQALSGVINIVTKEGGQKYTGSLNYRTDEILPEKARLGQDYLEFSSGGPILGMKKRLRYFISVFGHKRDGTAAFNYQPKYPIVSAYESGTDSFKAYVDTAKVWWYDHTAHYLPEYYHDLLDTARYWQDYYEKHPYRLPHTGEQDYRVQGKFTILPAKNAKLLLSGFYSRDQWDTYGYGYSLNGEQLFKYREFRNRSSLRRETQLTLTFNHILKNNLFYTLNIGRFDSHYRFGIKDPSYENERTNSFLDGYFKDYRFIPCKGFDPDTAPLGYYPYYFHYNNPWGFGDSRIRFVGLGDYRVYHTQEARTNSAKLDVTWQANKYNEFKIGTEVRKHKLDYFHNSLPWDPNPFLSIFNTEPTVAAAYVQDKMEFEGLVVNAGIRFDYVKPHYKYYIDASNIKPDSLLQIDPNKANPQDAGAKYQLSPRLGISHPITENQVLHFAYGYFFQTPPLYYFYDATNNTPIELAQRGNNIVGNPNLQSEKEVSYEAGVSTQLNPQMAFDVTAYYKDIFRWVGTREILAAPNPFYMYVNADYGNVRGLEVTYQYAAPRLSFRLSYTLQYAEGTASDPWEAYLNSYSQFYGLDPRTGQPLPVPHNVIPLSYDIRHTMSGQLSYTTPRKLGPANLLGDMNLSLIQRIHSGEPYTPLDLRGNIIGNPNSARLPWFYRTDMNLYKTVNLKGVHLRLGLEVFNIFNIKNITQVYAQTGKANTDGSAELLTVNDVAGQDTFRIGDMLYNPLQDINGDGVLTPEEVFQTYLMALKDYQTSPNNYGAPRRIRLGIEISF